MCYLLIIITLSIIISVINMIVDASNIKLFYYPLALIAYILMVVGVDAIVAVAIRSLPESWFDKDKKLYVMNKKEKRFFELMGIKKWKGYVLDLGSLSHFKKGKIENPKSNEYLERYMLEARYGVLIHYISAPLSFLIILFGFGDELLYLTVGLPVAIVNFVLILVPAFTLKYNLAKIRVLHKRNMRTNKEIIES